VAIAKSMDAILIFICKFMGPPFEASGS